MSFGGCPLAPGIDRISRLATTVPVELPLQPRSSDMRPRPRRHVLALCRTLPVLASILLCLADPAASQTVIQHGWEDGTLQGWAPFGSGVLTNSPAAANT